MEQSNIAITDFQNNFLSFREKSFKMADSTMAANITALKEEIHYFTVLCM